MKRNRLTITISLIALIICTSNISAQEILTLDSCRNLAVENNKSLQIASEQERIAYYQKKEAFSKFLPSLNATGAYLRLQNKINILPESITMPEIGGVLPSLEIPIPEDIGSIDIRNIYVGSVSLTQPLFMGGRIVAYNDIRKNAELLAKAQKNTKLQDIISEIDATYWQVVSLSWKKKLAESYVDLLKKMETDVTIMNEEGVATRADILSVSVKLNEAEMTLTKVNNGLGLSKMLLNQLCGIDVNKSVKLADENKEVLLSDISEPFVPNIEEAINNRSEIQSLEIANKIYQAKERVQLAEFLPQVGLRAGYTVTNPSSARGFEKKFHGGWNVGVIVKIPFNLGNFENRKVAKSETIINRLQLEEAKQKIELQINQNTYKLNEAHSKLTSSEKNLEKADENLRYAQTGFTEGVISASDVLGAHTAWLQAHSEVIDSQIDVKLCNVYLNKSLGKALQ